MFGFSPIATAAFSSTGRTFARGTSANILVVLAEAYGAHGVAGLIITNIELNGTGTARIEENQFQRGFFASV